MRRCLICLAAIAAEVCGHAFGIGHPEILSQMAFNYALTSEDSE